MLVIIVGLTLEVAHKSRKYFEDNGYEVIKKFNYSTDKVLTKTYYDARNETSLEKVLSCDFVYNTNGVMTGFNKSQIIDSVRGRKNCLMTLSTENLEFIKQIKSAYGEYVNTVFAYIDKACLEEITRAVDNPKNGEIEARLNLGEILKKEYIKNMDLFDNVVIYGGENSQFNMDNMFIQYDFIINEAIKKQKRLNDEMYVELPYSGYKNYIFVSYSHKDYKTVFSILSSLQREGYRIWYDEGINGGENWATIVGEKINHCTNFLLFSSENAVESFEISNEINAARMLKISPITVRIDEKMFPLGTEMYLSNYYNLNFNADNFPSALRDALNIKTKI